VLCRHDAGVVDHDIERRVLGDHPSGEFPNRLRIGLVELGEPHSRVGAHGLFEGLQSAARDDHSVAPTKELLRQPPTDSGASSGDQDRVARHLHGALPSSVDSARPWIFRIDASSEMLATISEFSTAVNPWVLTSISMTGRERAVVDDLSRPRRDNEQWIRRIGYSKRP